MSHQLPQLRDALLNLHKTLVESERVSYEQTIGTISSPNHFLQLLANDSWFAWLHPVSLLVVAMDQAIDSKRKPLTDADAEALTKQARELLVATEEGEGFPKHYYDALQRDPDVVMAHAAAAKFFAIKKRAN
jgi:ligand-binding sensor domain-containing protein